MAGKLVRDRSRASIRFHSGGRSVAQLTSQEDARELYFYLRSKGWRFQATFVDGEVWVTKIGVGHGDPTRPLCFWARVSKQAAELGRVEGYSVALSPEAFCDWAIWLQDAWEQKRARALKEERK